MSNCASFDDMRPRSDKDLITTMVDADSCPVCTPDKYVADNLRLVKSMSTGIHYGLGPGRNGGKPDNKVEVGFCFCTIL